MLFTLMGLGVAAITILNGGGLLWLPAFAGIGYAIDRARKTTQ